MAFGVLQDKHLAQPMGTALLEEFYDRSGGHDNAEVILVPAPSNSPHDPLNWSRMRKEVVFLTVLFGTCATACIGPLFTPGFVVLVNTFHEPISRISLLNGTLILTLGVSAYLSSFLAGVVGNRLIYLTTTIILIATCAWGAASQSYNSLLGARILQGFGMGSFFALSGSNSINDVFFIHQRGRRVGLWNAAIIGATNLCPIVSGYVIVNLSWRWTFGILGITFGAVLVCVFFFFPETKFERCTILDAPDSTSTGDEKTGSVETKVLRQKVVDTKDTSEVANATNDSSTALWRKVLLLSTLQIGDTSRLPWLLIEPLLLLAHPAVLWTSCAWAVTFGWGIINGLVAAQIFSAPPFNLSPTGIGVLSGVAPLIGSSIAAPLAGWTGDYLSQRMAIRNNGVYEPEFRLVLMIPFLICIIIGTFGLGIAIENGLSVITCGVFLAILNFGMGIGATGIVSYSNDVCQHKAGQALGIAMLVKSVWAFGLSFMLNDYYDSHGPRLFYFTWGGLNVGLIVLSLPLYVYGKRIRSWATRHNILRA